MHYFPRYEVVTTNDRVLAWEEDVRHVQGKLVNKIMRLFTETYLSGD